MNKVAVIDVGTNSVLALVIDAVGNTIYNKYHITELGKGFLDGKLRDERIEYTFQTIARFYHEIKALGCDSIYITGTSASREASNINRLGNRILDNLGIDYQIISGNDEARYTFLGALSLFKDQEKNYLMMDIGGGSTELIFGNKDKLHFKKSYRLGAVRLFNKYSYTDRLNSAEIKEVRSYVRTMFSDFSLESKTETIVGIGGTFTTAASVYKKLERYDEDEINNTILSYDDLETLFKTMNGLAVPERAALKGMEKKRAPYILFGSLIYLEFMNFYEIKSVHITDRGLRYGFAFDRLKNANKEFDKNSE